MSDQEVKVSARNQVFLEKLTSDDPGMNKQASDAVNEFTRTKLREDGFARRILPPIQLEDSEIDRSVDTDKPVKIVDKEPDSPAAITVPFAKGPVARYIRAPRYRVMFNRILTPRFNKDVEELKTYHMDVRQIISDNAIKDMLATEDGQFIYACNNAMVGPGSTVPETGTVQWVTTANSITRDNILESKKTMRQTPSRLSPAVGLVNQITVVDIEKWDRAEVGGDLSQDLLINGFSQQKILGLNWIVTIKEDLVPTSTFFHFAEPKFLGKFFLLEDATMHMKKEAFMIEFFAYESLGAAIGNVAGITRWDFNDGS